jgi:DNA-directed RNA polymerase specialized sigma54-like protein
MPSVFSIKQDIIKESQAYYDAISTKDKEKSKENLQKQFKRFHWFRHSHKKDYENIEKIIRNII